MRNLLRSRRGSVAFATVIALVPLIGVVALGGEAGSWYVTKQHAQNAADGAAYSGALTLACSLAANCADTQSVDYRGKEFAAQNAFCNAGDATSYPGRQCAASPPTDVSQAVAIATLTSWNGVNGNFVQATVQQTQPAYLSAVLGFTTIPIGAPGIAAVNPSLLTPPCALALTGSLSFQGSPNINAPGCTLTSNDKASNALDFTGGGMSFASGTLCGGRGLLRFIDILWRFKRKTLLAAGHRSLLCSRRRAQHDVRSEPQSARDLRSFNFRCLQTGIDASSLTRPPPRARIAVSARKAIAL